MKNNYFLVLLLSFAMLSINAQFTDDMESYINGFPISGGHWTDWGCGGGIGCAIMSSDAEAHSGTLSGLIPDDGTTDAVLNLDNKTEGDWGLEFWMYVPSGQQAYYNLQGLVPIIAGEWLIGDIYYNYQGTNAGEGFITWGGAVGEGDETYFNFPHDTWFPVVYNFYLGTDLSTATFDWYIDGVAVVTGHALTNQDGDVPSGLGGIDFYSTPDLTTLYYLDDFTWQNSPIGMDIDDLATKDFSIYPNPIQNELHLSAKEEITKVSIFNLLGQKVYSSSINALNYTIDTSSLARGAYIVEATIGDATGSLKIVK